MKKRRDYSDLAFTLTYVLFFTVGIIASIAAILKHGTPF